jgi:hypothetical protein
MGNFLRKLFTKKTTNETLQQDFDMEVNNFDTTKVNNELNKISFLGKVFLQDAIELEKILEKPEDLEKIRNLIKFYKIVLDEDFIHDKLTTKNNEENKILFPYFVMFTSDKNNEFLYIENYEVVLEFLKAFEQKRMMERNNNLIKDETIGGRRKHKSKAKMVVALGRHRRHTKKQKNQTKCSFKR